MVRSIHIGHIDIDIGIHTDKTKKKRQYKSQYKDKAWHTIGSSSSKSDARRGACVPAPNFALGSGLGLGLRVGVQGLVFRFRVRV